jgi:hypothetical protein
MSAQDACGKLRLSRRNIRVMRLRRAVRLSVSNVREDIVIALDCFFPYSKVSETYAHPGSIRVDVHIVQSTRFSMKHLIVSFHFLLLFVCLHECDAQSRRLWYAPPQDAWRLAIEGGVGVLGDDNTKSSNDYHFRPVGGVEVAKSVNRNIIIGMYAGGGRLRSTTIHREANTGFFVAGLMTEYRIPLQRGAMYPLIQLRGGALSITPELMNNGILYTGDQQWHLSWSAAIGLEVVSWRRMGVRALFGVSYTSTDRWDLLVQGDDRDGYSFAQLGITWYLSRRR